MLPLVCLALFASAALAAPGMKLPRAFDHICRPNECSDRLFQGTDTCYKYCVDGTCDIRADCHAGCSSFCNDNCQAITDDLGMSKSPKCLTGLPQTPVPQAPANPNNLGLPEGYTVPSGTVPNYVPVTNPSSFLPESEQQPGTGGDSVALLPLTDENLPIDQSGTDENLLAFTGTVPLDDNTFSTTNNQDLGPVAYAGSDLGNQSSDDFNSLPPADGSDLLASNPDSGYDDFVS